MKKILLFIVLFLGISSSCNANYSPEIQNEINEQLQISNAESIKNYLPDYSNEFLKAININNIFSVQNLNVQTIFRYILRLIRKKLIRPIKIIIPIATLLITYSIFSPFCNSNGKIFEFILSCSVCILTSYQLINTTQNVILALKIASKFVLCFIPIFMTFAISSGYPTSASIFNSTILFFNQIIMELTENLILPINNIMSSLCIISSLSTKIRFSKIFDIFYSILKWILIFFATTISFVFSMQKIVGNSIDNAITKRIKFISGLVPIVGSALGDAAATVKASSQILQANIGAFGVISIISIFLPPVIECLILEMSLQFCEFLSQILEFKNLESLFSSIKKVINMVLAIIIIFLFMFIFVTGATLK